MQWVSGGLAVWGTQEEGGWTAPQPSCGRREERGLRLGMPQKCKLGKRLRALLVKTAVGPDHGWAGKKCTPPRRPATATTPSRTIEECSLRSWCWVPKRSPAHDPPPVEVLLRPRRTPIATRKDFHYYYYISCYCTPQRALSHHRRQPTMRRLWKCSCASASRRTRRRTSRSFMLDCTGRGQDGMKTK